MSEHENMKTEIFEDFLSMDSLEEMMLQYNISTSFSVAYWQIHFSAR
jgi:hypothetical protein